MQTVINTCIYSFNINNNTYFDKTNNKLSKNDISLKFKTMGKNLLEQAAESAKGTFIEKSINELRTAAVLAKQGKFQQAIYSASTSLIFIVQIMSEKIIRQQAPDAMDAVDCERVLL